MKDYYSVLGVSPNATDKEIKAAYYDLARKYHPDNYNDNPLASLAEEKMKEINEAYDAVTEQRKGGKSSGTYGSYNKGGYSKYSSSPVFAQIRQLINAGRIDEAFRMLNSITDRTAEWYFLMGAVYYRMGHIMEARRHFQTAANMEPNNIEYRQALNNMNANVNNYGPYRAPRRGASTCDMCTGLICADCCCECMGGDLISCC